MEHQTKTQQQIEQEMLELNQQFSTFLHTKGIGAKFKVAFANIGESAQKQRAADTASFQAVKAQSTEDNKEFVAFLHAKGLKAKYNLVVEDIKAGVKAAPHDTAAQIAKIQAQTQQAIAHANACAAVPGGVMGGQYTAAALADEFNAYLQACGLDGKYTVFIAEETN